MLVCDFGWIKAPTGWGDGHQSGLRLGPALVNLCASLSLEPGILREPIEGSFE